VQAQEHVMKRLTCVTAVLLGLTSLTSPYLPAKEVVEIKIRGHFYPAPATVPITIAVEPGEDNRALTVEMDSDDFYRSSTIDLDGKNEKRLHMIEFKSLPAGEYMVRAEVRSKTQVLGTAVNELVVTGQTPER
jgi:hypothetical protein